VGIEEVYTFDPAEGARSFFELLAADAIDQVDIDPATHVVVLPYSSGTTGLPKGVELTHRNLVANLAQSAALSTVTDDDVILAVLPFFHIYGLQVLMNGVLYNGARAVTLPRFDMEQFLETIQDHRVTRAALVPPIILGLAKHPLVEKYDLSSLIQVGSGAAPLSAEVEQEAAARTGAEVVQGFGLTETSPVTHAPPPGEFRSGSIGVPVPNTEIRVVDPESGEDLGPGEQGELWIRGPQVTWGWWTMTATGTSPTASRNSSSTRGFRSRRRSSRRCCSPIQPWPTLPSSASPTRRPERFPRASSSSGMEWRRAPGS
jgi:4-coumarate--CoA ligase